MGELAYEDPRELGLKRNWRYARLITVSSFVQDLAFSLLKAFVLVMYTFGMINLFILLMHKDAADRLVSYAVIFVFVGDLLIALLLVGELTLELLRFFTL